jgi:iron(III) transport system substrate-binding protein
MLSVLSRRAMLLGAVVAAALASLVGASIATSSSGVAVPPDPIKGTLAKLKGLKPDARTAKLLELAKAEGGQVSVYTSLSATVVKPLQTSWADEYPDVKLTLYRASSEDVSNRFLSESAAGTHGADIVETNGTTMLIYQHKKNLLVPYQQSPFAVVMGKNYRFDTFTADRIEKFIVAWNTNLVSDPPKSFQDLADPKWKGKLSMEPTDADWYGAIREYFTTKAKPKMTPAAVDALFKKIAANSQLIGGHTNQINALASGQVSVVVTGHAQATEQLQARKAPIAFSPFVTPVIERPQGVGISYLAQHPAAALLFYDWMLRGKTADGKAAGQKTLQDNGVEPANPYYPDSAFASNPLTYKMNVRTIVSHWAEANKIYSAVVGG